MKGSATAREQDELANRVLQRWVWGVIAAGLIIVPGAGRVYAQPAFCEALWCRTFDLHYETGRTPLLDVRVWARPSGSLDWILLAEDVDCASPARLTLPGEGRFEIYLRLEGPGGASGSTPDRSQQGQISVLVDETPPILQVTPPSWSANPRGRAIRLEWTAIDDHLSDRPIEISYRVFSSGLKASGATEPLVSKIDMWGSSALPATPPGNSADVADMTSTDASAKEWVPVSPDPLPNTGAYLWTPPDGLTATVVFRITVVDRVGHAESRETPLVSLDAGSRVDLGSGSNPDKGRATTAGASVDSASGEAALRAQRLVDLARQAADRGQWTLAETFIAEALGEDEGLDSAHLLLAEIQGRRGRPKNAAEAYARLLSLMPGHAGALRGLAETDVRMHDYESAESRLKRILADRPEDGQTWLELGDVAIKRGNEYLAREHFRRAAQSAPKDEALQRTVAERLQWLDWSRAAPEGRTAGSYP